MSMVETITPVVHGGRRTRWGLLLLLHTAGATASAAAFGALLGVVGALLGAPWGLASVLLVAVAAAAYLAREALGVRVPVPQLRRQVPDWWRSFFPFAPAAFLYGVGLGVGFLTYLTHGTLVVVATAAVAAGRPLTGALLLAPFGLARGLSAIVARNASTPEESTALVGRLARSASWGGWRAMHAVALALVLVSALAWAAATDIPADLGGLAAAALAVVFGFAAFAKMLDGRRWNRALRSYGLPDRVRRGAAWLVPMIEIAVALLVVLGFASTAGVVALGVLLAFSGAIVIGRVRRGRRLDCGCFGGSSSRDYRFLLGRNAGLAVVAFVAWREGVDAPVTGSLRSPGPGDLVPVVLVVLGLALVAWLAVTASVLVRRGSAR
jgi:hypothetical protein